MKRQLVVDPHAPQQDGQTGKSKLLGRSGLRILVQSLPLGGVFI
jgi:hypothetical protein